MTKQKWALVLALAATLILVPAVVIAMRPQVTPYKGAPVVVQAPVAVQQLNADTILSLVNNERVKAGLKPLVSDPRLVATAQERADDMAKRNYFSHFDPVDGHKMINDQDFQCKGGSENISKDWATDAQVVSGWMGSKLHHDAILRTDYTLTGLAVNGHVVVQHFCTAK